MINKICPSCGGSGQVKEWTYSDWFMTECSWCQGSGRVRAEPLYEAQCGKCFKDCLGCPIYARNIRRRHPNQCQSTALANAGKGKLKIKDRDI